MTSGYSEVSDVLSVEAYLDKPFMAYLFMRVVHLISNDILRPRLYCSSSGYDRLWCSSWGVLRTLIMFTFLGTGPHSQYFGPLL